MTTAKRSSGGLVIQTEIRAGRRQRRQRQEADRAQLRILQELHKEAATTKRWEFSTESSTTCASESGAVDPEAPEAANAGCAAN